MIGLNLLFDYIRFPYHRAIHISVSVFFYFFGLKEEDFIGLDRDFSIEFVFLGCVIFG